MTTEEAQSILALCRDAQAAANDPRLREALALAARDKALGTWWLNEQAFDRAFRRKLAEIEPPLELQDAILTGGAAIFAARQLIADSSEDDPVADAPDNVIPLPQVAREKAVIEAALKERGAAKPSRWGLLVPLSMAASFIFAVLGIYLFLKPARVSAGDLGSFREYAETLVDGGVRPQHFSQQLNEMQTFLDQNHAPELDSIPQILNNAKLVGCGVQDWEKHRVSEVELEDGQGSIHLFVLSRDEFPSDTVLDQPLTQQEGRHLLVIWAEGHRIYVMVRLAPEKN